MAENTKKKRPVDSIVSDGAGSQKTHEIKTSAETILPDEQAEATIVAEDTASSQREEHPEEQEKILTSEALEDHTEESEPEKEPSIEDIYAPEQDQSENQPITREYIEEYYYSGQTPYAADFTDKIYETWANLPEEAGVRHPSAKQVNNFLDTLAEHMQYARYGNSPSAARRRVFGWKALLPGMGTKKKYRQLQTEIVEALGEMEQQAQHPDDKTFISIHREDIVSSILAQEPDHPIADLKAAEDNNAPLSYAEDTLTAPEDSTTLAEETKEDAIAAEDAVPDPEDDATPGNTPKEAPTVEPAEEAPKFAEDAEKRTYTYEAFQPGSKEIVSGTINAVSEEHAKQLLSTMGLTLVTIEESNLT